MKILIATSIYPPDIGGPAQYAKNLAESFRHSGHSTKVVTYGWEKIFPAGIKHFFYLLKIIFKGWNADIIIVLDTFLVAVPTMFACVLMGKKYLIRTGGDLLWEWYVERTGDLVLLSQFYQTRQMQWNKKEKIIFKLTRRALHTADKVVFSTDWQRQIWREPYGLDIAKTKIIENYYGPKVEGQVPTRKNFVFSGRAIKLKNLAKLEAAFTAASQLNPEIVLESVNLPHAKLMEKIAGAYAIIVPSVSEVSPNFVMEALKFNKPSIVTSDCGLRDRLGTVVLFFDSSSTEDLAAKIIWLADSSNYQTQLAKLQNFSFKHSWDQIAGELLTLINTR